MTLGHYGVVPMSKKAFERAKPAAEQALRLDQT